MVLIYCSTRSRVKGHLQLYMAYITEYGENNSEASGEQTPEEAGWEVLSIDNSSGHEEAAAQVYNTTILILLFHCKATMKLRYESILYVYCTFV